MINGLHHITAVAGEPQRNVDFYAGVLGMRLVKRTVNFDAPDVYHLYYGDETGSPGAIMTFFPFADARRGRKGTGQAHTTGFSVPKASLGYWQDRLRRYQISFRAPQTRFDETFIALEDPDGLALELVFTDRDVRPGWGNGPVPAQHAIRGFYHVSLWLASPADTIRVLTELLDHQLVAEADGRARYAAQDRPGHYVDVIRQAQAAPATGGSGTVHHVAFSTDNDARQLAIRQRVAEAGLYVTEVRDRQYFHSIYFREPGGVLFEVATDPPGFALDEDVAHLGEALKLPPQEEHRRAEIEKGLAPIRINLEAYAN